MPEPQPPKWHTREDSGFVIDRNVDWWHDGERIEHPNIIEAFNRGLRIAEDGQVKLEFGNDWCFVKVVEAAFKVVAIDTIEGDSFSLRLSDRTAEGLDAATLRLDEEGVLLAAVKGGRASARFSREAHFELAQHFENGPDGRVQLVVGGRAWATSIVVVL